MSRVFRRGFNSEAMAVFLTQKRVADLKTVAIQTGMLSSGNKPELVERLVSHFESTKDNKPLSSVLSFDLGYRNLAYCHLSHDGTILDWARVDLDLPSFHPSVVAPVVRRFIEERVRNSLKTTDQVVVEQQRARSAGSFSVLEHTLRVNCVEAILWSGLYETVEKLKRSNLKLTPLIRQSVDRVWEPEFDTIISENEQQLTKIKHGTYRKKLVGSLLVQKWLDTDTAVICNESFKEMFRTEKKKDDLSDCLLQAMAWYKWEHYSKIYVDSFILDGT